MNVVDIRSDLRMVLDSGPGQAYLLRRGTQAVLIDTGIAGQGDAIADALVDWGLDREALTHVLLTHWHADHVGSAAEVSNWPNAQIWAHRLDAPIIRGHSYGTFPSLTPTEQQFYAQIAGTVPSAAAARVDREFCDDEYPEGPGRARHLHSGTHRRQHCLSLRRGRRPVHRRRGHRTAGSGSPAHFKRSAMLGQRRVRSS